MSLEIQEGKKPTSYIKFSKARNKAEAALTIKEFKDGDFYVTYMPELDMSGYGNTSQEARDMLKTSLDFYFDNLSLLSPKKLIIELAKHNFKPQKFARKNYDYTGPYIDDKGFLQKFDLPIETEVQTQVLTV